MRLVGSQWIQSVRPCCGFLTSGESAACLHAKETYECSMMFFAQVNVASSICGGLCGAASQECLHGLGRVSCTKRDGKKKADPGMLLMIC